MGATKIMVIRHAEKPDQYNGISYEGVTPTGARPEVAGHARVGTGRGLGDPLCATVGPKSA